MCQTLWMNDADDFCLWAPPTVGAIGATERNEVAWCTKSGRGTRVIPDGTLKGVHFVRTKDYVQVTGVGDFTKINVAKGDEGGGMCFFFSAVGVLLSNGFFLVIRTGPSRCW